MKIFNISLIIILFACGLTFLCAPQYWDMVPCKRQFVGVLFVMASFSITMLHIEKSSGIHIQTHLMSDIERRIQIGQLAEKEGLQVRQPIPKNNL